jgi:hypothetical protein
MFVGGSSRTSEHRSLKLPTISHYPSSEVFFLPLTLGLAVIDREAEAYFVCVFYGATTSLSRIHPLSSSVQAESRPPAQSFSQENAPQSRRSRGKRLEKNQSCLCPSSPTERTPDLLAHLWHVTNLNLQ